MEGAVHRFQVVVRALFDDLARLIALLIHPHGREHAVFVPGEVTRGFEKLRFGDVRGIDEFVSSLFMATSRVVLHLQTNDSALGVEHGKAGANFVREREQIEFLSELSVISLGRFFEALQVSA